MDKFIKCSTTTVSKCLEGNTGTSRHFSCEYCKKIFSRIDSLKRHNIKCNNLIEKPLDDSKEDDDNTYRSRNFCFTLFRDNQPPIINGDILYLAYGNEICPTTGRAHYQSYIVMKKKISIKAFRKYIFKWLGVKVHCEIMRGSLEDNDNYCSKEGSFSCFGIKPHQGKKTDLLDLQHQLLDGKKLNEIIMEEPNNYHIYSKTLLKMNSIINMNLKREWKTTCDWFYGDSGSGKSEFCFLNNNITTHYLYTDDNEWWENYNNQHTVVIDEFRGSIQFNKLLNLCDKYPYNIKSRFIGSIPFMSKHIIISSSKHPKDVYKNITNNEDSINQLLRRIRIINTNVINDYKLYSKKDKLNIIYNTEIFDKYNKESIYNTISRKKLLKEYHTIYKPN